MNSRCLWLFVACWIVCSRPAFAVDPATTSYDKHIAPFFKTFCLGCHNGDDDSKGGLDVRTFKSLMVGGDNGVAIVPGKAAESRMVRMLLGTAKPKMPPKDSKQPRPDEIELVRKWVEAGAVGPVNPEAGTIGSVEIPRIEPKRPVSPAVTSVAFSRDGKWLAAVRHREVVLFDAISGQIARTYGGGENPINSVSFSADSRWLAAGEGAAGIAGRVLVWDVSAAVPAEPRVIAGHVDSIYSVAFAPDGKQLATASYDKLLKLWDVDVAALTRPGIKAGGDSPLTPGPSPQKERGEEFLRERATLKHHTSAVFCSAFSPDGQWLASVAADQTVKVWNVASGQRVATLTEATKGLSAVAFHPQGRELTAVGIDKMIRVWEWNGSAAKLRRSAVAHDAPILALAYSPDGGTLFTASEDRRIKSWDAVTLREKHVHESLADWPLSLAVSPDGKQLAVGLFSGELLLFETQELRLVRELIGRKVASAVGWDEHSESHQQGKSELVGLAALVPPYDFLCAAVLGQAKKPKGKAPGPRLDSVSPRSVVRGQKVKLTLAGQQIHDADRIFVSPSQIPITLLPGDEKKPNQLQAEIDLPADFPPGVVTVRLHAPLGSTGAKSFYVGPFAEIAEKDDNNSREKANVATLPATLTGAIETKGDRDVWAFDVPVGSPEIVFQVASGALGSVLTPKVSLLDTNGKLLGSATRQPGRSDVVIGHKFEQPNRYYLQIEDRNFTGSGNHFYLIHAGQFAYVTGVFPPAARATDAGMSAPNEVAVLGVRGYNLGPDPKLVPVAGAGTKFVTIDTPVGKSFNAARFEASSISEFVEAESNETPTTAQVLPVPSGVSGRIVRSDSPLPPGEGPGVRERGAATGPRSNANSQTTPPHPNPLPKGEGTRETRSGGDVDHFAFDAKAGQRLTIEVFARRLGSPLDSIMEIITPDGRPVGRHTLQCVAETYTVLRDHDSKVPGIRLQAWDDFQPNDLLLLGGEVGKIRLLPLGPDEDVKFFEKGGLRLGYLGATPQAHALNSAAYKVEVHPPGKTFPPNGMPVVPLNYVNDDGGPGFESDSRILFDAPADGRYVVRVRDVRGFGGDDFSYRLVIRPRQEDFRVSLEPENPNIPEGGSIPVTVNVERLDGFNGPIEVTLDGLPSGITATSTRVLPDFFNAVLTLTAAADAPDPEGDAGLKMKVTGKARIGDQLIERNSSPAFGAHQVSLTSPPDLLVRVEPTSATIRPGEELRFTAHIERRNDLKARIPIDVLNLPHGLRVIDVGLNGVLINETETSRSFVIHCDPWAEPGPLTFYAAGKIEAKGNERHTSPAVVVEVKPNG
ncbi:MAG: hypothetical protein HZA46_04805 [Planctomycetales bacterium]|nr:hypothetical protein [Planctomycetales bacterium]